MLGICLALPNGTLAVSWPIRPCRAFMETLPAYLHS